MSLYFRKIELKRWVGEGVKSDKDYLSDGTDGVTNCCRTKGSTISLWKIDSEELVSDNDRKILINIASLSENILPIEYVTFSEDELLASGFNITYQKGGGSIKDVATLHYNISDLSMDSISKLGLLIRKKVNGVVDDEGNLISMPSFRIIPAQDIVDHINLLIRPKSKEHNVLMRKKNIAEFMSIE